MATAYAGEDRGVSVGRAISGGFGTIASNPLATLGIAFLFGALPGLIINYFTQQIRPEIVLRLGVSGMIGLAVFGFVVGIVFAVITQGALVRATVAHLDGQRATIGESVGAGLRVIVPLVLLSIVLALGVGIGFVLLLVPGIILYVMWSVASPALVTERAGVFEALSRSAYLTKGARWKVFGLTLLIVIFFYICAAVVSAVALAIYGGMIPFAQAMQNGLPVWYLLINGVVQTVIAAVWGTIQAALYVELRNWKDGPPTEALADIFA